MTAGVSFQVLVEKWAALFAQKFDHLLLPEPVAQLRLQLLAINDRRNRLVHSMWALDVGTGLAIAERRRAKAGVGEERMDVARRFEVLGTLAIITAIYGFSVLLAMHFLAPEVDPIRAPGSAYVLGPYGAMVTTIYFTGSVGNVALGYGLKEAMPQVRLVRIGWLLFLVAAVGAVVAGLFPMDFPPPIRTTSGRLHALGGGISFALGTLGIFLFSLGFRRDQHWRQVSGLTIGLSAAILGALLLGILSLLTLGFAGSMQRVLMMLQIAWVVVVGLHLRRFARIAGSSLVDKAA